jgi:hypothetical protein
MQSQMNKDQNSSNGRVDFWVANRCRMMQKPWLLQQVEAVQRLSADDAPRDRIYLPVPTKAPRGNKRSRLKAMRRTSGQLAFVRHRHWLAA